MYLCPFSLFHKNGGKTGETERHGNYFSKQAISSSTPSEAPFIK